jgi:hypothetical protein
MGFNRVPPASILPELAWFQALGIELYAFDDLDSCFPVTAE